LQVDWVQIRGRRREEGYRGCVKSAELSFQGAPGHELDMLCPRKGTAPPRGCRPRKGAAPRAANAVSCRWTHAPAKHYLPDTVPEGLPELSP